MRPACRHTSEGSAFSTRWRFDSFDEVEVRFAVALAVRHSPRSIVLSRYYRGEWPELRGVMGSSRLALIVAAAPGPAARRSACLPTIPSGH